MKGSEEGMKSTIVSNPLKLSLQFILLLALISFNFGSGTPHSALALSASSSTLKDIHGAVAIYEVAAASAPPVNDNFANAFTKTIGTIPYQDSLDTTGATEAGDGPAVPGLCDGRSLRKGIKNVWYQYTAASNRQVFIDTFGSIPPAGVENYDTYLAAWTGPNINNLTLVGCDDDDALGYQSQLSLSAVQGTTYYIEVAQYNGELPNGDLEIPTGGTLQLHVSSFQDAPGNYWAWRYVEGLYNAGVTAGCNVSPLMYCPSNPVTRDQMAVFLLKAEHGSGYTPPTATGIFQDVPTNYWAAAWIEQLAAEGITAGCSSSPMLYCPTTVVARDQMAVFLLKAEHGSGYTPPTATGIFQDVPTNFWAAAWIEQLAAEGITAGCSATPQLYCPTTPVSRDQMAVFLDKTFSIPLLP
jgi:S-layer homology domain